MFDTGLVKGQVICYIRVMDHYLQQRQRDAAARIERDGIRAGTKVWCVVEWRCDNRYSAADAYHTYRSEKGCVSYINRHPGKNLVARCLDRN